MSRPRSSVPNGCEPGRPGQASRAGSAPTGRGGRSPRRRSRRSRRRRDTTNASTTRTDGRPRRTEADGTGTAVSSSAPLMRATGLERDPRVDREVDEVGDQVDEDDHEARSASRAPGRPGCPCALIASTSSEPTPGSANVISTSTAPAIRYERIRPLAGDDRHQRVAQDVRAHDPPARDSAGTRERDVVLLECRCGAGPRQPAGSAPSPSSPSANAGSARCQIRPKKPDPWPNTGNQERRTANT